MILHTDISDKTLRRLIRGKTILFAGNRRLKIYGRLDCRSGKRMKSKNRVFFENEEEALSFGYRACRMCLR